MEQEVLTKASQCLWCGARDFDFLHHQYILPVCPGCLDQLKQEK